MVKCRDNLLGIEGWIERNLETVNCLSPMVLPSSQLTSNAPSLKHA